MQLPLMPKATAVWLVDNTSLTFEQIAEFCGLHPLEVKGIADGEVATGIVGQDPIKSGQLSREEIERGESNASYRLKVKKSTVPLQTRTKGPRYTPVAKRQERPDAIAWLLKHHPELDENQLSKLLGTTKQTIKAVRDRTHWNSPNIKPRDPVLLGLCSQTDLNNEISKKQLSRSPDAPKPEGIDVTADDDENPSD